MNFERERQLTNALIWGFAALVVLFFVWAGMSIYQQEKARAAGPQIGTIYETKLSPAQSITSGEVTTHIPETYYIYIENDGRTNWFSVRKETYWDSHIGDTFSAKCYCITQRKE